MTYVKRYGGRKKYATKKKGGLKKEIKRLVSAELKEELVAKIHEKRAIMSATNAGLVSQLSAIQIGTLDTERIGDQVIPSSMRINYFASLPVAGSPNSIVRVMVIRWLEELPGDLDIAEVFESGTGIGTSEAPLAFLNFDGRKLFNVLYDKVHVLSQASSAVQNHVIHLGKKHMRKIQYIATSTTNQIGSLQLFVVSTDSGVNSPSVHFSMRMRYTSG